MTISEIRVEEVLQGKVEVGDTIAVTKAGGEIDGVTYADSQLPPLSTAKDSSLLLALAEFEDGTLAPLNPSQAVLVVASDGTLSPLGENNMNSEFSDLTLDMLRRHTSGR